MYVCIVERTLKNTSLPLIISQSLVMFRIHYITVLLKLTHAQTYMYVYQKCITRYISHVSQCNILILSFHKLS